MKTRPLIPPPCGEGDSAPAERGGGTNLPRQSSRASPTLTSHARAMRRALTPAEATLWKILRTPPLDSCRFRRQVVFPPRYIADFASHTARLVIEADGPAHNQTPDADTARTHWLNGQGYAVIRFSNAEILANSQSIWRELCARTTSK